MQPKRLINSKVRRLDEIRGEGSAERSCRQVEASNSRSREQIAKGSDVGGQLGLPRLGSYGSGTVEYKP